MMDILPDLSVMSLWLAKYGSFVLFFLLSLGIIALPIPEETLMTVSGILMHEGKLNIPLTIFFAYAGTITGITVSYLLGKSAGSFLVHKYGYLIGLTNKRLNKVHNWFVRLGLWLLTFGYFIPGIRHLTGFFAGTTDIKYTQFALYAYTGALFWVSLFLSLGYFVGDYVFILAHKLEALDLAIIAVIIILLIFLFFVIRKRLRK